MIVEKLGLLHVPRVNEIGTAAPRGDETSSTDDAMAAKIWRRVQDKMRIVVQFQIENKLK